MTSPTTHSYRRRVQFADTDAAGVAHFSRLLVMVEEAVHDFLLGRGIPVITTESAWPFVSLAADYKAPCFFDDEITLSLEIKKTGTTSLAFAFVASQGLTECFRGTATLCHIHPATGRPTAIPETIRSALTASGNRKRPATRRPGSSTPKA
jgi:YbgC/YbaW family acyl-CoA thioester hydrolase